MSDKIQQELALLGFDVTSNEFSVFQAILLSAGGEGNPVTYSMMIPVLEQISERTFTKAYVYRCLNALEKENLISVDSIHHPRQYKVTEKSLGEAIKIRREKRKKELRVEEKKVKKQLSLLKNVSPQNIAFVLADALSEHSTATRSLMIEGVENVRSTVIREFAEVAKEGDTIRVLANMSTILEGLGPGGMAELRLMQTALKGVKVVGLLVPSGGEKEDTKAVVNFLQNLKDPFQQMATTGLIGLKFGAKPTKTYRMVTLNDEKMLLYFTHAKESDMAALIQRRDNPGLIDDAIATFENLWSDGTDAMEILQKML